MSLTRAPRQYLIFVVTSPK